MLKEIRGLLLFLSKKSVIFGFEILVRDGKGVQDRITMLPESLKAQLQEHFKVVKAIHDRDLADGWGRVVMPNALDRKCPNASSNDY